MSEDFTRISSGLWHWDPFIGLDPAARCLWLALYTSPEARGGVPGLFFGSITAMADACKMPAEDTMKALDKLLERELAEYDQKHRVLRLTLLPDAGEYPSNPCILKSWWKKFQRLAACQVRDAHVQTIRWILERGAAEAEKNVTKKPTPGHEKVWAETFATVAIPAPRRRGLRRLVDADTSTDVQPSLFPDPYSTPSPTLSEALPSPVQGPKNEIEDPGSYTLSRGWGEGGGEGGGDGVSFSSSFSSGSGAGGADVEHRSTPATTAPRPRLALVPAPADAPYTPEMMLEALSGGDLALVREGLSPALRAIIADLATRGVGLADIAAAGKLARGGGWVGNIGGDPRERLSVWAATPGQLLDAITKAHEHERAAAERSAMAADARRALGIS